MLPCISGDDFSAFNVLSRPRVWPNLKEFSFTTFFVRDDTFGRWWLALAQVLQSLNVSAFPHLARISLSLRLGETMERPLKGTLRGIDASIHASERLLLQLHEEASFEQLTVGVAKINMGNTRLTSGHIAWYDRLLKTMFPRLHAKGMLVLNDESWRVLQKHMDEMHPNPDPESDTD